MSIDPTIHDPIDAPAVSMPEPASPRREFYLNLTPDILAVFPGSGAPFAFYGRGRSGFSPVTGPDEKFSSGQRAVLARLCRNGSLFVSRADFALWADYLARRIAVVVGMRRFSSGEMAEIAIRCLALRVEAVFAQPLRTNFDVFRQDMAAVASILGDQPSVAASMAARLRRDYSLVHKAVNTGTVAMGLFLLLGGSQAGAERLAAAAEGFFFLDLGLRRVPEFILGKESLLNYAETRRVREHPQTSAAMLRKLGVTNGAALACVRDHHERLDGSGYPGGKKGRNVHPLAGLCAVADSFCAMRFDRAYRPGLTGRQCLAGLQREQGRYQPIFLRCLELLLYEADRTEPWP